MQLDALDTYKNTTLCKLNIKGATNLPGHYTMAMFKEPNVTNAITLILAERWAVLTKNNKEVIYSIRFINWICIMLQIF